MHIVVIVTASVVVILDTIYFENISFLPGTNDILFFYKNRHPHFRFYHDGWCAFHDMVNELERVICFPPLKKTGFPGTRNESFLSTFQVAIAENNRTS